MDEVRELGGQLGVYPDLVVRYFPPRRYLYCELDTDVENPPLSLVLALAFIIGECTSERVRIAREADHIYIRMIREAGLYNEIGQAYGGVDTSQAAGVMAGGSACSNQGNCKRNQLRAVQTTDFMTAEVYPFDMKFSKVAPMIRKRGAGHLDRKPPGTIELQ
ncbi:hypothetical protein DL769_001153 [Monosporascus sp. CRB-8-3]|nr:hypothetical protein DL769_001153 [Monosporascus sp. CRB-8-3]